MTRVRLASLCAAVVVAGLAGCGDNDPGNEPADLVDQLRDLPGVTVEEAITTTEGFKFYILWFTQPIDHANPNGPTFEQRVSLLHKDIDAPMVALTSGYWDYYRDRPYELTSLISANQISIEHRFFGESRPEPADWTTLTIKQMADDQHRIISELRKVYPGAFITTGGSKGGMTAIYHRRFYPDDVDGTVPYVAPISFGAPDLRYVAFLDTLGPTDCREDLRAAATELIANRRAAMLARAMDQALQQGYAYTRISIGAAVESSIASVEWAFWQYYGVLYCPAIPSIADTDDELWEFLNLVAPVSDSNDEQIASFEAYYFQAYEQLGFPDSGAAYLDPYLVYTDADYLASLPTTQPAYDGGAAMRDIDTFVKTEGHRLLFVYGQWDPWTGGPFELGAATDSLLLVQPQGSHGSRLSRLAESDRDRAFEKIAAWTGVTPTIPMQQRIAPAPATRAEVRARMKLVRDDEPRIPPAMLRAINARR